MVLRGFKKTLIFAACIAVACTAAVSAQSNTCLDNEAAAAAAISESCLPAIEAVADDPDFSNFRCPSACSAAFRLLGADCLSELAASDGFAQVISACNASPDDTPSTPSDPTPSDPSTDTPSDPSLTPSEEDLAAQINMEVSCIQDDPQYGQDFVDACLPVITDAIGTQTISASSFDCTTACQSALEPVSASCINEVASGPAGGELFSAFFEACGISGSTTDPSPPSDPVTAAPTRAAISPDAPTDDGGFSCLTTDDSAAFQEECVPLLQELQDATSTDSITCPTGCTAALEAIDDDCIAEIVDETPSFQAVLDFCNAGTDSGPSEPSTDAPVSDDLTDAPTAEPTPDTPVVSDLDTTPTQRPTPAPILVPQPQGALPSANSMASLAIASIVAAFMVFA